MPWKSKRSLAMSKYHANKRKKTNIDPTPNESVDSIADEIANEIADLSYLPDVYESIMNEPIEKEYVSEATEAKRRFPIEGLRIVNLSFVIMWAMELERIHRHVCILGNLFMKKEIRRDLVSTIIFECDYCHRNYTKKTIEQNSEKEINYRAVWAVLSTGGIYAHFKEWLAVLNISSFPQAMFTSIQTTLMSCWKTCLIESMEEAGKAEKQHAIEKGNVDKDGTPWITVVVDGGWSKRSYGHNYNSNSGVAVIIGSYTKKLLFIGVRNKYCLICTMAKNKQCSSRAHICYKNWSGASTAMESDILVEGFNSSEKQHGLRYKVFIGDGDSNAFARLRELVSYGSEIQKNECLNHVVKSYGKALIKLGTDTKFKTQLRKQVIYKRKRLQVAVKEAVRYNSSNGSIPELEDDLKNSIYHVFGNHTNCKDYYCLKVDERDFTEEFKLHGLWPHLESTIRSLASKSNRLISNKTSNAAETYMNICAKFNAGKRLNLVARGSYEMRCYLAGLCYNLGVEWHSYCWPTVFESSMGDNFLNYITNEFNYKAYKDKKILESKNNRKIKTFAPADCNYGPAASDVDLRKQLIAKRMKPSLNIINAKYPKIASDPVGEMKCIEKYEVIDSQNQKVDVTNNAFVESVPSTSS